MEVKVKVANVDNMIFRTLGLPFLLYGPSLIVLKEIDGDRILPLTAESDQGRTVLAAQIVAAGNSLSPESRPTAHDLLFNFMQEHDLIIEKVTISDSQNETCLALIHVKHKDGRHEEIDSRPTDAIVLAIKAGCDIFVSEKFLKELVATKPDEFTDYQRRRAEEALREMGLEEPKE